MKHCRGFSLIEVLVASAIIVSIGAIVFQIFQQSERIFRDEAVHTEMQQAARMVISQIGDDIRMAGQGVPPALGDLVLPGSDTHRLNIRSGFSATESIVTTPLPVSLALGSPSTLKVENTTGFSSGKQIFVWNAEGWFRATVNAVSGPAKSILLTPSVGSGPSVQFNSPPLVALDEAVAIYLDTSTNTVRRTTATNTISPVNPGWAPANDIATSVGGLDFSYFDSSGNALVANTSQNLAAIAYIEARVQLRGATPLAGGALRSTSLSVRVYPRNLQFR